MSLDGLRLKNARAPGGLSETISDMPFAEPAIEQSVTPLSAASVPLPAFEEGYLKWRRAFDAGKRGIFTISVAESVGFMERVLNP